MRTDYHLCHIVNKVTIGLLHLLIIRLSPCPNQPKNNQAHSSTSFILRWVGRRDFEVFRPRFQFINQFKYTSKQKMDGPYSQGASEAAHRDEAFSNLSTKPNISEENECGEPESLLQQSQEVEGKAQNLFEFQPEAERVAHHRSQSIDQGNQSSSNRSSALQYPHQSRQLQQPPKQPAGVIVSSSGKTYQLKTFGEDWEHELKQQEELREQYHELINTNNQPLLTQKEEHDIQFGTCQMLLTQKEEPQAEGKREADQLSNEVKFKGNGREIEEVSEHPSSQSQKENEVPCQPLFEIIFNDNSQSNLLDFGFKVQGQRRSNGESNRVSQQRTTSHQLQQPSAPVFQEEPMDIVQDNQGESIGVAQETNQSYSYGENTRTSYQQNIHQQSEHPSVPANEQVPMDIIQYNKEEPMEIVQETSPHRSNSQSNRPSHQQYINQQPQQQQPEAPLFQEEPMDIIHNNQKESMNIVQENSQSRLNEESSRVSHRQSTNQQPEQPESNTFQKEPINTAQETSPPKQSEYSQHIEITVSNCQVQNSTVKNNDIYGITQVRKEDESQVKKYEESQLIKNQNPFRNEQQPKDSQKDFKRPLSFQEIIEEMASILKKDLTQQQKAEQGFELLKDHIDLYFLKPLSDIGASIVRDGKLLINLIQIILLKEKDENQKSVLRRYLILNLAKYISTNTNDFIDYQQAEGLRKPYSQQLSNEASIDKRLNDTLNQTDFTVNEVDESNYAKNGSHHNSAIHKSPNYMVDALEEPVKRTVANRNFVTNTETRKSPKSGKITRKRYKTKTKGKGAKTSAKKSQVQFQIPEENQGPAKFTRSKGRPKSIKKEPAPVIVKKQPEEASKHSQKKQLKRLQDNMMKRQSDRKDLGAKFTFIQREDRRDAEKQLVQVRVSQRLAQKKNHSPRRYSSSKLYEDEAIDLNYIKEHLAQFKIIYEQMDEDYEALTSRDQEILDLLKEYFSLNQQMEEEERSQHRSQEGGDYVNMDEGSTISVNDGRSNTIARLEEFKKNLDKYKPSNFSFPISVARVVDPDINNHGIYALLELGKMSEIILKAKYALTPITALTAKLRKQIDQDVATAKSMVGDERDNLAYLQPTPRILELIKEQKRKRQQ